MIDQVATNQLTRSTCTTDHQTELNTLLDILLATNLYNQISIVSKKNRFVVCCRIIVVEASPGNKVRD